MERVLFTTNPPRRCGVCEFGRSTFAALKASEKYEYVLAEFAEHTTAEQFAARVAQWQPIAVIHNWHPLTMPWLTDEVLYSLQRRFPALRHAAVVHDEAPSLHWIDAAIFNDPVRPAHPREFCVGRCLWDRPLPATDPGPVIGSFGFALPGKGFERVVEQVNREFDTATVRLHLPASDYCDPDGARARAVVEECQRLAKPGITIEVSHHYLDSEGLLDWLAGNAVNCFLYDQLQGRGISSVIDFALSARRPIAISNSAMFRHVVDATPTIVLERSTLKQIIANGLKPLQPYLQRWTSAALAADYDRVVDEVREYPIADLASNRVLTPRDRERLRPAVAELHELCPGMMSRKFPQAVFQNAFIFEQARHLAKRGDSIILVGGYEDPIGPALERLGYRVTITDPQVDGRDSTQVLYDSLRSGTLYDLVISCSVLEHVEEDVDFVQSLFELLKPGGTALLTADFRADWHSGIPKPAPDVRLYSPVRLRVLADALPPGSLIGPPAWDAVPPYFHYDGSDYGFCSFAFRRPPEQASSFAARLAVRKADQESAARHAAEGLNRNLVAENAGLLSEKTRLTEETIHLANEIARLRHDSATSLASTQAELASLRAASVPIWKKVEREIRTRRRAALQTLKRRFWKMSA